MYDFSNDWLLKLVASYEKEHGKDYHFLSDWNTNVDDIKFPKRLIKLAANSSKSESSAYAFAEDQNEKKELVRTFLSENNIVLPLSNITIAGSATASLYAYLLTLKKNKVKSSLWLSPV